MHSYRCPNSNLVLNPGIVSFPYFEGANDDPKTRGKGRLISYQRDKPKEGGREYQNVRKDEIFSFSNSHLAITETDTAFIVEFRKLLFKSSGPGYFQTLFIIQTCWFFLRFKLSPACEYSN